MIRSFIKYGQECHFPIQNLPYGIFSSPDNLNPRAGVAIGTKILDLSKCEDQKLLKTNYFKSSNLNEFLRKDKKEWSKVRESIQNLLLDSNPVIRDNPNLRRSLFYEQNNVEMHLPVRIGDYTDFYSSKQHATNVGAMFRDPKNALLPNWLHMPVGYHGRSSSIVITDTNIKRPNGQIKSDNSSSPNFGPSNLLDFELEVGCFIGNGNNLGEPIEINQASDYLFGLVLVNDWSARDIQKWEYVPLGPFLSKNLVTSISPWIVTLEALEPFRVNNSIQKNPTPLKYLNCDEKWTFDINLEVYLKTNRMSKSEIISKSNYKYMYWNLAQQLTHHTVTGCNMTAGDLIASGTISGEKRDSYGSMLELSWKGTDPVLLSNGEERRFLQDDDEITMTGYAQGDKFRVGFGNVRGKILPAD